MLTNDASPLRLWTGKVLPEWLDYNGHMTEFRYLHVFGDASDALYAQLGVDFEKAQNGAFFTLETHIRHKAEAKLHTPLSVQTQILAYDGKKLHLWHELYDEAGVLLATGEHLSLHMAFGKPALAANEMLSKIDLIFQAQKSLPYPQDAGRVLRKNLEHTRKAF